MAYTLYRCIECDYEEVGGSSLDGMRCNKCEGAITPIKALTFGEAAEARRNTRRRDRVIMDKQRSIQYKMEYLDKLTLLNSKMPLLKDGNKNMIERINDVCNSIEKDLGLNEDAGG